MLLRRRAEFENDWNRRLDYLVLTDQSMTFEGALQTTVDAVRLAQQLLGERRA
jgi:hypothetical protein